MANEFGIRPLELEEIAAIERQAAPRPAPHYVTVILEPFGKTPYALRGSARRRQFDGADVVEVNCVDRKWPGGNGSRTFMFALDGEVVFGSTHATIATDAAPEHRYTTYYELPAGEV